MYQFYQPTPHSTFNHSMSTQMIIFVLIGFLLSWLALILGNTNPFEVSALYDLYSNTDGSNWKWKNSTIHGEIWDFSVSNPNPCSPKWQGVYCFCYLDECTIIELDLERYNLKGSIPSSISNLTNLEMLSLSNNYLIGTVPSSVGYLKYLRDLNMGRNRLVGEIPKSIGNLYNLSVLNLGFNFLSGTLPDELFKCTALLHLKLPGNHIKGTLSESIGKLVELEYAHLFGNFLAGTLPASIGSLTNMVSLRLYRNAFTGSIPSEMCKLRNLWKWYMYDNILEGSLPPCIGNMSSLAYLDIGFNFLTGTIPQSIELLNNTLTTIYLYQNELYGPLPVNLFSISTKLTAVVLYNNIFTGPMPVIHLPRLTHFELRANILSGTLSESLSESREMSFFDVSFNQMNGALPANFSLLKRLNNFMISENGFTGEIPSVSSYIFFIDGNQLTGTLPSAVCSNNLIYVNVGGNLLHGTIPDCNIVKNYVRGNLSYFAANNNFFSGTIPSYLTEASNLQALTIDNNMLTGSLASMSSILTLQYLYVQNNKLTGQLLLNAEYVQLEYVDVSNNQFSGTLPVEMFHSNVPLISFAATSNCITGSIPKEICSVTSLIYLNLDGLATNKACRDYIFPRLPGFTSFTLPKQITGGIPLCLLNMSLLQTLQLSGNSIEWKFPDKELFISKNLTTLSMSHNKLTGTIPMEIQSRQWESIHLRYNKLTGWLNLEEQSDNCSIELEVNRLSGDFPSALLNMETISILVGNLWSCPWNRHNLPVHDSHYRTYQCGSNSFNQSILSWSICVLVVGIVFVILLRTRKWQWQKYRRAFFWYLSCVDDGKGDQLSLFRQLLLGIRDDFVLYTVGISITLVPVYAVLSAYYGTTYDQYAWTVSAAFLSGTAPGITLMILYMCLITYCFAKWYVGRDALSSSLISRENSVEYVQLIKLSASVFFNCVVMILINGAYVYVNITYNVNVVFMAQIVTATFKLIWNDLAVKNLIKLARPDVSTGLIDDDAIYNDSNISKEMSYMTFIILFNSIIAPCLASAVVNSDCFYNVFVAPASGTSQFPIFNVIENCDYEIGFQQTTCYQEVKKSYIELTYDPPFIYSYQCTSSILTNYASVYVLMFMITVFVKPVALYIMQWMHTRIARKTLLYKLINATMYSLLKPAKEKNLLNRKVLFHKDRFALRMIFKIAILITFGVIFPPLAVVTCLAIVSELYLNLFIIGRYLALVDDAERHRYRELLCRDCEGCVNLLYISLTKLVVPFAAFFYAFYVFDIYGDKVGYRHSIWASILLTVVPGLLWIGFTVNDVMKSRQRLARSQTVTTGAEMLVVSPFRKEEDSEIL